MAIGAGVRYITAEQPRGKHAHLHAQGGLPRHAFRAKPRFQGRPQSSGGRSVSRSERNPTERLLAAMLNTCWSVCTSTPLRSSGGWRQLNNTDQVLHAVRLHDFQWGLCQAPVLVLAQNARAGPARSRRCTSCATTRKRVPAHDIVELRRAKSRCAPSQHLERARKLKRTPSAPGCALAGAAHNGMRAHVRAGS